MASKEHRNIAEFIKGVHLELRLLAKQIGAEAAWKDHCNQKEKLQKYASLMHRLATDYWDKNNDQDAGLCRLHWVALQCIKYFYNGRRRIALEKETAMAEKYGLTSTLTEEKSIATALLLDVGSCYNPFKQFPFLNIVPIDIAPATADVKRCDFLSVETIPCNDDWDSNSDQLVTLPENHFDVVVFSLLLEYLPSPEQRYLSCQKAFRLLQPGGLLIIMTPDSNHASANAPVMKSWRLALAHIGFWRVVYQKLRHLHCMVYRKCHNSTVPQRWFSMHKQKLELEPNKMICIPQDSLGFVYEEKEVVVERNTMENELIVDNFSILPVGFIFD